MRLRHLIAASMLLTLAVGGIASVPARAATPPDGPADLAQELAEKYAPVMMLAAQDHPCDDKGEQYIPMPVEAVLGNPQVALRQLGSSNPVVMWGPTAKDLYGLGDGFYLDYPGHALSPGCLYEKDSKRYNAGRVPTIYAHVVEPKAGEDQLVVEYWFFWYFNDWNNKHEGDWEGIQLIFPATTVEQALQVEPVEVGYAQHEGGQRSNWTDGELETIEDHPVVYSSRGSHASYLGSAVFIGRGSSEGFGCDDTANKTRRVDPAVVLLPDAPSGPDDPFAWLGFEGHWGEDLAGPFNGPTGPNAKGRYLRPLEWQANTLRDSSVVVPAGDGQLHSIVELFCGAVEFGSSQYISFQLSPTRGLVTVGVLIAFVLFVIRRTRWRPADPSPLVRARAGGQVVSTGLVVLRQEWWLYLGIGLITIPLGFVVGLLGTLLRYLPFFEDLVVLSESDEWSRLMVSVLTGGAASILSYVVVAAGAAWITAEIAAGRRPQIAEMLRAIRARWRPLVKATLVAGLIVLVFLIMPVIGFAVAVWLLVRFQYVPQVVMLEDLGAGAALRRSSDLVRHKWWRTAWMVALIHGGAIVAVAGIGLIVLVALQLPFWALSLTLTLAGVLSIPLAATAMTFLYGNALSRQPGESDADLAPIAHAAPAAAE